MEALERSRSRSKGEKQNAIQFTIFRCKCVGYPLVGPSLGRRFVSDSNLWKNARPYETVGELVRDLEHAELDGLDLVYTIFGPGDISAGNIITDEDDNNVTLLDATNCLLAANFVPRNWISASMLGPAVTQKADIAVDWMARPGEIHSGKLAWKYDRGDQCRQFQDKGRRDDEDHGKHDDGGQKRSKRPQAALP